jgi:Uma2 family endonuclease
MTELETKPMAVAEFRAWYAERPEHERWELIDGECVRMMTPPTKRHQQIAANLHRALDDALVRISSPLRTYQRVGVNLGVERYDPEPDVVVVDDRENPDERYANRVCLAAEVVSQSDEDRQARKLRAYREHEFCRHVLLIEQDRVEVVHLARAEKLWVRKVPHSRKDVVRIEEFGLACPLDRIYDRVGLP